MCRAEARDAFVEQTARLLTGQSSLPSLWWCGACRAARPHVRWLIGWQRQHWAAQPSQAACRLPVELCSRDFGGGASIDAHLHSGALKYDLQTCHRACLQVLLAQLPPAVGLCSLSKSQLPAVMTCLAAAPRECH